ncbi:B-cell receptor-associated protein 31-like protein [Encephalitozoon intestinalis ATCC 50506]|uniref:Endoplasmic reticulum transmembrane protein n=1 Tax=Encephalitozoon intestinalis (strain ATCC 50506) TaxID=876142 RepID=E0S753_ENCIT|nr:B-cell receptor-associated protein 31-like protein [Encephalitozoon intestinalis ATCC 50506]ADM11481.1 B-cell receptor-associated protein 31-like protein [Encephalitozoon intestinalis ATCC 50506]UTX45193.1 hypothetical protein GPK93_05g07370 [Encephalitozoon intestinalis]
MGITTQLVQSILFGEMCMFTFMLLPISKNLKKRMIRLFPTSKLYRGFLHIIYVLFAMILIMFVDSAYKIYTGEDHINPFVLYQAERNMYLTGFTLFLGIIFRMFTRTMCLLFKEEESAHLLRKQSMNQKKYVEKILEENTKKSEKIEELEAEIGDLKKKILSGDILIKQLKNNQNEYFSLLDKYNGLREQMQMESKKSK